MDRQFDPARLEEKHCLIVENDGDLAALRRKAEFALRQLGVR